jgi:FkbM family methyltransferase
MSDKLLKKICGLFGYRLIDKVFFKNNRLISRYSLLNIKKILSELFIQNEISSIVQIGANNGIRFDELNQFINEYETECLLVEPIKENFEELYKKYNNLKFVKLENSAISINNEISFLYKVDTKKVSYYGDHIPGITSFNKNHLLKHGVKNRHIIKEKIQTISIKQLFTKHAIKSLDLLYVDTEGYDGKIVLDFLSNIKLRPIIIFEYIHIDNNILNNLLVELKKNNYRVFPLSENIVCFPSTKKISINL